MTVAVKLAEVASEGLGLRISYTSAELALKPGILTGAVISLLERLVIINFSLVASDESLEAQIDKRALSLVLEFYHLIPKVPGIHQISIVGRPGIKLSRI